MTWVMVVRLAVLSGLLYLVFRRADEARALQGRVEELRRELEVTKRHLDEARKKIERVGSLA